jgi:hypothetical protein
MDGDETFGALELKFKCCGWSAFVWHGASMYLESYTEASFDVICFIVGLI